MDEWILDEDNDQDSESEHPQKLAPELPHKSVRWCKDRCLASAWSGLITLPPGRMQKPLLDTGKAFVGSDSPAGA